MNTARKSQWLQILAGATATTSAPSAATAGVAIPEDRRSGDLQVVRLSQSATSGSRSVTIRLWGYCDGDYSSSGLRSGSAGWVDTQETLSITAAAADGSVAEVYQGLNAFSRLYAQVTAISGTGATANVSIELAGM
jgi:hypothetical protein